MTGEKRKVLTNLKQTLKFDLFLLGYTVKTKRKEYRSTWIRLWEEKLYTFLPIDSHFLTSWPVENGIRTVLENIGNKLKYFIFKKKRNPFREQPVFDLKKDPLNNLHLGLIGTPNKGVFTLK